MEEARRYYLEAAEADRDAARQLGGAEAFLWCAQLSEEGGEDSIRWYDKACRILRQEMSELEEAVAKKRGESDSGELTELIEQLERTKDQLGEALCSMAEVYMTDLSYVENRFLSQVNLLPTVAIVIT